MTPREIKEKWNNLQYFCKQKRVNRIEQFRRETLLERVDDYAYHHNKQDSMSFQETIAYMDNDELEDFLIDNDY